MGINSVNRKAVFLDRDGVLNRAVVRDGKPHPPSSLAELVLQPGISEACRDLHRAGFLLIMVTNQPDVARGTLNREVVEAMNQFLADQLSLDDIKVCYHDNSDNCQCRKPAPGLLLQAAQQLDIDLSASFLLGDRWKDVEAGQRAGCKTVFLDYGYKERRPQDADYLATSVDDAAAWICKTSTGIKET